MNPLSLTLPADAHHAVVLRDRIRAWFDRTTFANLFREDVLLVTCELFSNAVRAADSGSTIEIALADGRNGVLVSVTNTGPPFSLAMVRPPSADQPGGRGILIAKALGTVFADHRGGVTTVRVLFPRTHRKGQSTGAGGRHRRHGLRGHVAG